MIACESHSVRNFESYTFKSLSINQHKCTFWVDIIKKEQKLRNMTFFMDRFVIYKKIVWVINVEWGLYSSKWYRYDVKFIYWIPTYMNA